MTEWKVSQGSEGSGVRQWGADWFFRRDGNKTLVNAAALKWTGAVGVVVFAALQFSDSGTVSASSGLRPEPIDVPPPSSSSMQHEFPVVVERPLATQADSNGRPRRGGVLKLAGPQLIARPRNLAAIPPGSLVKATLVSGASNGPAKAKLEEPLIVNGDLLLEEGAVLVGQGNSTEERLMLSFTQVVFRDGSFGNVQAQACDSSDQIVGLKGSRIGTKTLSLAGSVGLGLVGGLTEALQDTQGQQGVAVRPPSLRNALLHATATTALDQSRNLMSDLKEERPVIEVPAGTILSVLFGGGQ
jgi:hypothetical protein